MATEKCKAVVLGGGSVGKSCLTLRYLQGKFIEDYNPTIEESYRKMITVDENVMMLEVLDTAGQEEFRSVQDKYFRSGEGFLMIYSIVSRTSFVEIQNLHESLRYAKNTNDIPTVTVGNKSDLVNDRQISSSEGQELASKFNSKFFETSAKTGDNVQEAFEQLIREIKNWKQRSLAPVNDQNIKPKKKRCFIL
ncbi:ras-like protein [Anaeramoeba ignava]|uniref:small monomeric GTPase n=1 Tax=Anaeramoeba ignava TaxID=1746090 RepID=A0A9Q0LQ18_ANAIG|nr:ras-like protein [Anaeramoeba ignava]